MVDYPGAISYLVDESRVFIDQNSHSAIVLHGTGGNPNQTVEELGDYFRTTPLMTSSHYGIGRDGRIAQYVLEKDGSGANGILDPGHDPFWDQFGGDNPNKHSISIECENDATNSLPLTAAQIGVLFPLVAYLVKKYQIPLSNIKGHFTLEPVERAECPGPMFPWDALISYLKGAPSMIVPSGWTYSQASQTLTAPNGHTVHLGNARYILNAVNWDPKNVPLEEEHGVAGGGTEQLCLQCKLAWNPTDGVHIAPLGQQYQVVQQALANETPASLQALLGQASNALGQIAAEVAAAQAALKAITPAS